MLRLVSQTVIVAHFGLPRKLQVKTLTSLNATTLLKILLAMAALFHLTLGAVAMLVPPSDLGDRVIDLTYGASFTIEPVTHHIIRILGAFMFFVGIMATFAFRDPAGHRSFIYALMTLFVIRVLQRIIFADEIQDNFNISTVRLVTQSIFFAALAAAYYLVRPRPEQVS